MNDKSSAEQAEFDELRRLLLGPELDKIERLRDRLESPEAFSSEVGEVLPRAMIKSTEQHREELSQAMIPTVEEIVRQSVKKDINRFADALFPVIGPAIRKSIKETLRQMLQSLNRALEMSLSWQGLRWRLESMRTGIPFAEIALLHALVYRVEQVFLIHRRTGLLLCHRGREDIEQQDPDLVSSMLTAINDFVADSFAEQTSGRLDRIEAGELSIWIEPGPDAVLALAIRGEAPNSLRTTMQVTLERIQVHLADSLAQFGGDTSEFAAEPELLDDCLQAQYASPSRGWSTRSVLALLLLVGLLFAWAGTAWQTRLLRADTIALVRAEPGYVVTRTDVHDGRLVIEGMRDPLARQPGPLLEAAPLTAAEVDLQLEPYQSLADVFVAQRSRRILQPPESVQMDLQQAVLILRGIADLDWRRQVDARLPLLAGVESVDDAGLRIRFTSRLLEPPPTAALTLDAGVLYIEGSAPQDWIAGLATVAETYPEIDAIDTRALVNLTEVELLRDIAALEKEVVLFDVATSFDFDGIDTPRIAGLAKRIIASAQQLSLELQIVVRGFSDSIGSFEDNRFLSIERADFVAQAMFNTGISPRFISIKGLEAPVRTELSEAERRYNRRVGFEVILEPGNQD